MMKKPMLCVLLLVSCVAMAAPAEAATPYFNIYEDWESMENVGILKQDFPDQKTGLYQPFVRQGQGLVPDHFDNDPNTGDLNGKDGFDDPRDTPNLQEPVYMKKGTLSGNRGFIEVGTPDFTTTGRNALVIQFWSANTVNLAPIEQVWTEVEVRHISGGRVEVNLFGVPFNGNIGTQDGAFPLGSFVDAANPVFTFSGMYWYQYNFFDFKCDDAGGGVVEVYWAAWDEQPPILDPKTLTIAGQVPGGHDPNSHLTPPLGDTVVEAGSVVSLNADDFSPGCPDVLNFSEWLGTGIANPNDASTTVLVDEDKTVTAVYVDGRACADLCHAVPAFDFSNPPDCRVNLEDFAIFAGAPGGWGTCTHPDCDP